MYLSTCSKSCSGIGRLSARLPFWLSILRSRVSRFRSRTWSLTASPTLSPRTAWNVKSKAILGSSTAFRNLTSSCSVKPLFRVPYLGILRLRNRLLRASDSNSIARTSLCLGRFRPSHSKVSLASGHSCLVSHLEGFEFGLHRARTSQKPN